MRSTAIFGPPGTGKTTKMMDLVEQCVADGLNPKEVMYLSFTKAAAGEVLRRMGVKSSNSVSTIHSACYRLLGLGGASIVDYHKLRIFGHKIGLTFKGNTDDAQETMEIGDQYLSIYSLARNRNHTPIDEYIDSDRPGDQSQFNYFVESYENWKSANGMIDFTDMLIKYVEDPREHGCKAVFIDESQDLSPLQWDVIRAIIKMKTVDKVFFAGDDDQAIFEWAGANPHGMAEFSEYTGADKIVLGESFRLPDKIHDVVTTISRRIDNRVDKDYKSRGEPGVVLFEQLFEPTRQKEGFILCRTHSIKQKTEKLLIERRIPFRSEGGGLPGPLDCKAARAIRAWHVYKDTKALSSSGLEAMIGAAIDRVRGDLLAGDKTSILKEDPMRIFKIPVVFLDYFRDVDINSYPKLITMTIHASKGREADEVTLITDWTGRVQAGIFMNPDAEHWVWYVGASRAKHILRVTSMGEDGYVV